MQPKELDCIECFSYSAKISHRMNKIQWHAAPDHLLRHVNKNVNINAITQFKQISSTS